MPILDLPTVGKVQFDDNIGGDELKAQVEHLAGKYGFESPFKPNFTPEEIASHALHRGINELGNTAVNVLPALAAAATGNDDYAKQKLEEAKASTLATNQQYAPQYQDLAHANGIGQIAGWATEQGIEGIPTLLTLMIPGVGEGAVATRIGIAGATRLATEAAIKRGLEGEAKDAFITQALTKAMPAIQDSVQTGQHVTNFLGAYALGAPATFQDIYDKTGQLAPGAAAIAGAAGAALNSILPGKLANAFGPAGQASIVSNLLEKSGMEKGLLNHVTAGILQDAGIQAGAGAGTEAMNIAAEKYVSDNKDTFSGDDWNRVLSSAVSGAVTGAPFGVMTGLGAHAQFTRDRQAKADILAQHEADQAKIAAAKQASDDGSAAIQAYTDSAHMGPWTQGDLPGIESIGPMSPLTTPASNNLALFPTPEPTVLKSQAELTGVQGNLFDKTGMGPSKEVIAQNKAIVNQQRQQAQREAAETKATAARLKAQLNATQLDLPLPAFQVELPPAPVQGQPDLFNSPAPPTFEAKPPAPPAPPEGPTAPPPGPTPPPSGPTAPPSTILTADHLKDMGIGRTAGVYKTLPSLDLANPEHRATITDQLTSLANRGSEKARNGIDAFLTDPNSPYNQAGGANANGPDHGPAGANAVVDNQPELTAPQLPETPNPAGAVHTEPNAGPVAPGEELQPAPLATPQPPPTPFPELSFHVPEAPQTVQAEAQGPQTAHAAIENPETRARLDKLLARRDDLVQGGLSPTEALKTAQAEADRDLVLQDKHDIIDQNTITPGENPVAHQNLLNALSGVEVAMDGLKLPHWSVYFSDVRIVNENVLPPGAVMAVMSARDRKSNVLLVNERSVTSSTLSGTTLDALHEVAHGMDHIKFMANSAEGVYSSQKDFAEVASELKAIYANSSKDSFWRKFLWYPLDKKYNSNGADFVNSESFAQAMSLFINSPEDRATLQRDAPVTYKYLTEVLTHAQEPNSAPDGTAGHAKARSDSFAGRDANIPERGVGHVPPGDSNEVPSPAQPEVAPKAPPAPGSPEALWAQVDRLSDDGKTKKSDVGKLANQLFAKGYLSADATKLIGAIVKDKDSGVQDAIDAIQDAGRGLLYGPEATGAPLNDVGSKLAADNNAKGLISHLLSKATDPAIKQVLLKLQRLGITPNIEIAPVTDGRAGYYDPTTNTIRLDPVNGMNEHTVIHEMTHAAISKVLDNPQHPLTRDFSGFFNQIKNQMGDAYGGRDLQEFAAEITSNPDFQSLLKTIKAPKSGNMFQHIMQSVAEFFGFRKGQTAYDVGMNYVNKAIDISRDIPPHPADVMYLGTGNAFDSVSDLGKAMPELAGKTIDQAKNKLSNVPDQLLRTAMGVMRLDHLNILYGKALPAIQKILDAIEQRAGYRQQETTRASSTVTSMDRARRMYPKEFAQMEQMAIDARLAKVELVPGLNPQYKPTAENQAEHNRLTQVYKDLPSSVRDSYNSVRTDYENTLNSWMDSLLGNTAKGEPGMVQPSLAAKLRAEWEGRAKVVGYVPFRRYGDYKIEYPDPKTGERVATSFESVRERQQFIDKNLKGVDYKTYENMDNVSYSHKDAPPTRFIGEVMKGLTENGASQDQLDSVYQAFIQLMPAQSISKQFIKSENVLGMDKDITRGYATTMGAWITKISKSKYDPVMDQGLREVQTQGENSADRQTKAAAMNILSQKDFFHNPTFNTLTRVGTALSYFESIAGNLSSAAMNILYIPTMIMPTLAARHGAGPMLREMGAAAKIAMSDWGKIPRYAELYKVLAAHDQVTHTTSLDIGLRKQGNVDDINSLRARIMQAVSIPFSWSEKYNRVTTIIAAYELARKEGKLGSGPMTHEQAIRYALDTTKEINTSALSATSAKWMQNPLGRTILTFKNYAWNSAFVIARAFHQSFKGEDPAVRTMAQRQLLGILGMAAAFGGLRGMPFYGMAATAGQMINALFGDENVPFDFNSSMREQFGDLMYKGPVNYLTNLEIANRSGHAGDLIWRDDPKGVAQNGFALTAMKQAFGPTGSYLMNASDAIKQMNNGEIERSVEQLLPAGMRNMMKATRFATEGALTVKGDPIEQDVSAWNSMMQGVGFAPADLSQTYETRAAEKNFEREVLLRKTQLMNLYEMGQRSKDPDITARANTEISAFNKDYPPIKISPRSLSNAINRNLATQTTMMHGIKFNPALIHTIKTQFDEQ